MVSFIKTSSTLFGEPSSSNTGKLLSRLSALNVVSGNNCVVFSLSLVELQSTGVCWTSNRIRIVKVFYIGMHGAKVVLGRLSSTYSSMEGTFV